MPTVERLYRYPIKGLSAEPLQQAPLAVGEAIPLDRHFALAHGTTQFDSAAPRFLPKTDFLMLLKNEKLAALRTEYDDGTGLLSIYQYNPQGDEHVVFTASLYDENGVRKTEQFFTQYLSDEIRGQLKLLQAPAKHSFSDIAPKTLSCVNLASVEALEKVIDAPVDPLRFRANVYFSGAEAWQELQWRKGQLLKLGTATVRVLKTIERCAATNVNPLTAKRDMQIPQAIVRTLGHRDCGVYVEIVEAGQVEIKSEFVLI